MERRKNNLKTIKVKFWTLLVISAISSIGSILITVLIPQPRSYGLAGLNTTLTILSIATIIIAGINLSKIRIYET